MSLHRVPSALLATILSLPLAVLWPAAAVAESRRSTAPVAAGAPIDLNSADAAVLASGLQGIGASKARAIVEHRRRHGPFRSVDELALVKGIGPKTVERNRSRLRVGDGSAAMSVGPSVPRPAPRPGIRVRGEGPIIIEGMPRDGG